MESGEADGEAEASGTDGENDDGEAGGSSVEGQESEPEIPNIDGNHNEAIHESLDAPNDDDDDVFDDGTTLVLGGADGEAPGADVAKLSDVEEGCDLEGVFFSTRFGEKENNPGKMNNWSLLPPSAIHKNTSLLSISDF